MPGSLAQVSKAVFSTTFVSSVSVAFGSNTTSGNAIWAVCQEGNSGRTPTCADNINGSYGTQLDTINDTTNSNTLRHWVKSNITGGATTVTATLSASDNFDGLYIAEITGITTSPVDGHAVNTTQSVANGGTITSTNGTNTATAFKMGFSVGSSTGAPGITTDTGNGFTADIGCWNQGSGNSAQAEYKASVAAGTTAATFINNVGSTQAFNTLMVMLNESGSAPVSEPQQMMMGAGN